MIVGSQQLLRDRASVPGLGAQIPRHRPRPLEVSSAIHDRCQVHCPAVRRCCAVDTRLQAIFGTGGRVLAEDRDLVDVAGAGDVAAGSQAADQHDRLDRAREIRAHSFDIALENGPCGDRRLVRRRIRPRERPIRDAHASLSGSLGGSEACRRRSRSLAILRQSWWMRRASRTAISAVPRSSSYSRRYS